MRLKRGKFYLVLLFLIIGLVFNFNFISSFCPPVACGVGGGSCECRANVWGDSYVYSNDCQGAYPSCSVGASTCTCVGTSIDCQAGISSNTPCVPGSCLEACCECSYCYDHDGDGQTTCQGYPSPAVCGNTVCETQETCYTCAVDCGSCLTGLSCDLPLDYGALDGHLATGFISDTDHWYTFDILTQSDVTISTCGSEFDTHIWVYDGCGNSFLYENGDDVDGNCELGGTDISGGVFSELFLEALPAGTYYIELEGEILYLNYGNYELRINTPITCSCVDSDSDGYYSTSCTDPLCVPNTDCGEGSQGVNPGETEVCGDGIDQDCVGGDKSCPVAWDVSKNVYHDASNVKIQIKGNYYDLQTAIDNELIWYGYCFDQGSSSPAVWDTSKDVYHEASTIKVEINDVSYSLQEAVDSGMIVENSLVDLDGDGTCSAPSSATTWSFTYGSQEAADIKASVDGQYSSLQEIISKERLGINLLEISLTPPPDCGNGIVNQPEEECDGVDLNGQSCASQGFNNGGNLACTSTCNFDTNDCHTVEIHLERNMGGMGYSCNDICMLHDLPCVSLGTDTEGTNGKYAAWNFEYSGECVLNTWSTCSTILANSPDDTISQIVCDGGEGESWNPSWTYCRCEA